MDLAEGDTALRAAAGLLLGGPGRELAIDLGEILAPLRRSALLRHCLVARHELQELLRHHALAKTGPSFAKGPLADSLMQKRPAREQNSVDRAIVLTYLS